MESPILRKAIKNFLYILLLIVISNCQPAPPSGGGKTGAGAPPAPPAPPTLPIQPLPPKSSRIKKGVTTTTEWFRVSDFATTTRTTPLLDRTTFEAKHVDNTVPGPGGSGATPTGVGGGTTNPSTVKVQDMLNRLDGRLTGAGISLAGRDKNSLISLADPIALGNYDNGWNRILGDITTNPDYAYKVMTRTTSGGPPVVIGTKVEVIHLLNPTLPAAFTLDPQRLYQLEQGAGSGSFRAVESVNPIPVDVTLYSHSIGFNPVTDSLDVHFNTKFDSNQLYGVAPPATSANPTTTTTTRLFQELPGLTPTDVFTVAPPSATTTSTKTSTPSICGSGGGGGGQGRKKRSAPCSIVVSNLDRPLNEPGNIRQVNSDSFLKDMDKMVSIEDRKRALDIIADTEEVMKGPPEKTKRLEDLVSTEKEIRHLEDVKSIKQNFDEDANIPKKYLDELDNGGAGGGGGKSSLFKKIDIGKVALSPSKLRGWTRSFGRGLKSLGKSAKGCLPGFASKAASVSSVRLGTGALKGAIEGDGAAKAKAIGSMVGMLVGDCAAGGVGKLLTKKLGTKSVSLAAKSAKMSKCLKGMSKAVGPILGTAVGSGFTIYSLVGSIKAFQDGNALAVVDIVTDVISLVADVVIAVALIAGVAAGPLAIVGIVIAIVLEIAAAIAKAIMIVNELDSIVGLRGDEKFQTGWRYFWGMQIPSHLETLKALKLRNNAEAEQATWFLGNHTSIQCFVTSSWQEIKENPRQEWPWWTYITPPFLWPSKESVTVWDRRYLHHDNSVVDLGSTAGHWVYLHRAHPKDFNYFSNYKIFCHLATKWPLNEYSEENGRNVQNFCQNAIGVESKSAGAEGSKSCIISLGNGTDEAVGRKDFDNTFFVDSGHKNYHGDDHGDDTFILSTQKHWRTGQVVGVGGILNGRGGTNFLILSDNFWPDDQNILIDLQDAGGILQKDGHFVFIRNVQGIKGREGKGEVIRPDCRGTKNVDASDGNYWNWDIIHILEPRGMQTCAYDLTVVVGRYTKIENLAQKGKFVYVLPLQSSSDFSVHIEALDRKLLPGAIFESQHIFQLQFQLADVVAMEFDPKSQIFTMDARSSKISAGAKSLNLKFKMVPHKMPPPRPDCRSGATSSEKSKMAPDDPQDQHFYQPQFNTKLNDDGLSQSEKEAVGGALLEAEVFVTKTGLIKLIHRLEPITTKIKKFRHRRGYPTHSNTFIVLGGDEWDVKGSEGPGSKGDVFIIQGPFTGRLDGGKSIDHNVLVLAEDFARNDNHVELNLPANLLKSSNGGRMEVHNFKRILGRPQAPDRIVISCATKHVDGQGSSRGSMSDVIFVPKNDSCSYLVILVVSSRTSVINEAKYGVFTYEIYQPGDFDVTFDHTFWITRGHHDDANDGRSATHTYLLNFPYADLEKVSYDSDRGKIRFDLKNSATASQPLSWRRHRVQKPENGDQVSVPNIMTTDSVQFQVTSTGDVRAIIEMSGPKDTEAENFENEPNFECVEENKILTQKNFKMASPKFTFKGIDSVNHQFMLKNVTNVSIEGGALNDIFVLRGHQVITGSIEGHLGENILILDPLFKPLSTIDVNLLEGELTYLSVSGEKEAGILKMASIQIFQGRVGREVITVGCDTELVDGKGGLDIIKIPNLDLLFTCKSKGQRSDLDQEKQQRRLTIVIPSVVPEVINEAKSGLFIYKMTSVTSFSVQADFTFTPTDDDDELGQDEANLSAIHIYQLSFVMDEIEEVKFVQGKKESFTHNWLQFKVTGHVDKVRYRIGDFDWSSDEEFYSHPRILTADSARVAVSEIGSIYFIFETAHVQKQQNEKEEEPEIQKIVEKYQKMAQKLNVSMIIICSGEKIFIGDNSSLNILTNDVTQPSHLISGRGREIVFQILESPFPVTIYGSPTVGGTEHLLDLSSIVGPLRDATRSKYQPKFYEKKFKGQGSPPGDLWVDVGETSVRIVEGQIWAKNIKILLESSILTLNTPLAKEMEQNGQRSISRQKRESESSSTEIRWPLTPVPMLLGGREIVILSAMDIEDGAVIDLTRSREDQQQFDRQEGTQNVDLSLNASSIEMGVLGEGLMVTGFEGGRHHTSLVIMDFFEEGSNDEVTQSSRLGLNSIKIIVDNQKEPILLDRMWDPSFEYQLKNFEVVLTNLNTELRDMLLNADSFDEIETEQAYNSTFYRAGLLEADMRIHASQLLHSQSR